MLAPDSPRLPSFQRRGALAVEVAEYLRSKIAAAGWNGSRGLPGELTLAGELQVGRNTVRAALRILEEEGVIAVQRGQRRKVVAKGGSLPGRGCRQLVLLLAEPLSRLPHATFIWMAALQERFLRRGWEVQVVVAPKAYARRPEGVLAECVEKYPSAVWVLHRSSEPMQRWFQASGEKVVVAGSGFEGVKLPGVDIHYRAVCRHAAGQLVGLGHREIGLLMPNEGLAGDGESLIGFREGLGHVGVTVGRVKDETAAAVLAAWGKLHRTRPMLTALFAFRATHSATVLSYLLQQGTAVPRQISLLCRDDDPFLASLCPEPARYELDPVAFSKALARTILRLEEGVLRERGIQRLMPSFVKGGTLKRC